MSNALFLPRELFAPASAPAKPAALAAMASPRRGVNFVSGEAVAADLLQGVLPSPALHTLPVASTERRRQPRAAHARGVDLFIA